MSPPPPAQVRGNRWVDLTAPPLGAWTPERSVTVIIPCYQTPDKLALTMAALDRQTYPADLLSVLVVDDGSDPPLGPPPANRVLVEVARRERDGFGLARARNLGAERAGGEILIFLDCDMIPEPRWAEAHARWHHLVGDALTLGFRRHVEVTGLTAGRVAAAAESGSLGRLFDGRPQERPEWIEFHLERTDQLTRPESDLFRVVTGGNLGVRRETFLELGGFDPGFDRWGAEDTELGYRASVWGALLVPERAASAWHQGLGTLPDPGEARALEEQRALLSQLIAEPSFRPRAAGRSYRVPTVVVLVDASDMSAGSVASSVESALASRFHDLVVALTVPVSHPDAAWLHRRFEGDPRVVIDDHEKDMAELPWSPIRVSMPAGTRLSRGAIDRLLDRLSGRSVVEVPLGGPSVVVATTASLRREVRGGSTEPWETLLASGDKVRVSPRAIGVAPPPEHGRQLPGTSPAEKVLRRLGRIRSPHDAIAAGRWALAAARQRSVAWRVTPSGSGDLLEAEPWKPRVVLAGAVEPIPTALTADSFDVGDAVPDLVVVGPDSRLGEEDLKRVEQAGAAVVFSGMADPEGQGRVADSPDTLPVVDPAEFGMRLAGSPWTAVALLLPGEDPPDVEAAVAAASRLGMEIQVGDATDRVGDPMVWAREMRSAQIVFDHPGLHDSGRNRAVRLARLAAAAAPLVVDGIDSDLAALLGDELLAGLTQGDPDGWNDPTVREQRMVALRRGALLGHGAPARLRRLMAAGGAHWPAPLVSAVLATNRPEQLDHVLGQFERQTYPELEVVLALHGEWTDASISTTDRIKVIEADPTLTLGEVLQLGVEASTGELVTKMDDDDWYGPDHVWDLVLARQVSGAALVGKGSEFVHLARSDRTIRRFAGGADTWTTTIGGGALLIGRPQLDRVGGWRPLPRSVDRALIEDVQRAGGRVYRTHGFGYVLERRGSGHTWEAEDSYFLEQAEMSWPGLALHIVGSD